MDVDKRHWLTNGAEIVQTGDLVRWRRDGGEFGEWYLADHLAGSRVDSFAQWHGMGVQFARVPTATAEQPRNLADAIQRWQQESTSEPQWEMVNDRDYILRPGVDQVRCRTYLDDAEHWGPWVDWHTVQKVQTVGGFIDGPGGTAAAQEWQFRRRATDARSTPEQPPSPTTDRGERYRRTITQSLAGDTHGLSITVDLADVCDAFGVPYMLGQAVKKCMLPGERGSKDRLRDLREAAWHIQRQIQIEEARQQEQADL